MTWLRVDDNFVDHPKIQDLSDGAFRLHVAGLAHCARHLTDGRVKMSALATLTSHPDKAPLLKELLDGGLWELLVGGYEIHDFLEYNPSRKDLKSKRNRWNDRQKKHRVASRVTDGVTLSNVTPEQECVTSGVTPGRDGRSSSALISGSDPEGSAEGERPSEVRLVAAPPAPEHPDPDIARVAEAIRSEPSLRVVHGQALGTAEHVLGVGKRLPVAWYLTAVRDAAGDWVDGEPVHVTQHRLRRYLQSARAPKQDTREQKSGPAYREEPEDPAVIDRIRRMPKRVTAQDMPPPVSTEEQRARAMALVSGIGKGGS